MSPRVGLAVHGSGRDVEDDGIVDVKQDTALSVLHHQCPYGTASDAELPSLLSVDVHLVAIHLGQCVREVVGCLLHPTQVRRGRLLPGSVVPLVPCAVIEGSDAKQDSDQLAIGDDAGFSTAGNLKVQLAGTKETSARAEAGKGVVEHRKAGLLRDDGGSSGGSAGQLSRHRFLLLLLRQ